MRKRRFMMKSEGLGQWKLRENEKRIEKWGKIESYIQKKMRDCR